MADELVGHHHGQRLRRKQAESASGRCRPTTSVMASGLGSPIERAASYKPYSPVADLSGQAR